MGADIHGVVQVKQHPESRWYSDITVEDGRNYALFAALADVRNYADITPFCAPRGLPEGFEAEPYQSDRPDAWMGDHSFTWFTPQELAGWPGWDQVVEGHSLRSLCAVFLEWLDYVLARHAGAFGVRIVIGFDS